MTATERKKESSVHMTISIITLILVLFGYFVNYYTYIMLQYKQVWGRENYEIVNKVQMQQIKQMVDYYKANPDAFGKEGGETGATDTAANVPLSQEQVASLEANMPILGSKDAKISWIEYSDLECPYCKKHNEGGVYKTISESLGEGAINFSFKHFPLNIHPGSAKKHEALECARQLGGDEAYFKLKDKVFEKNSYQEPITFDAMIDLAVELGVKKDEISSCVSSGKNKAVVDAGLKEGQDLFNIDGTPATVIINNETGAYRFVSGARGVEDFKTALSEIMVK